MTKLEYTRLKISIHALREEGDARFLHATMPKQEISIHALREEGDTPPPSALQWRSYFYPRPPRGGRRQIQRKMHANQFISIHALREEGDSMAVPISATSFNFYPRPPRGGRRATRAAKLTSTRFLSTPSARRATGAEGIIIEGVMISIHALREEGDSFQHDAR